MSGTNDFQLKLKQTQQLSHTMQQSLRILQMSGIELEREVEDWLAENPLLEKVESEEPMHGDMPRMPTASVSKLGLQSDYDENSWENVAEEETLHAYLHKQVGEHPLSPSEAAHVHILIDFLDDKGYLTETLEEIIEHTPLEWMLEEENLAAALEVLQTFDPPGIATANLSQSLLHQISRLPAGAERRCAALIAMHHLDKINNNNTPKSVNRIHKALPEMSAATIKAALDIISSLHPYPAYGFSGGESTVYVRPDVEVFREGNIWKAAGNEAAWPHIRVNQEIADLMEESGEQGDSAWQECAGEAKQKIEILKLRKNTVLRVAEYIVKKQQDFFTFGEIGLVPMLLKDCAAELELAESTISRAVSGKYLSCPQGLFALRYFFSQNATGSNDEEGLSGNAIRSVLAQMVAHEDATKPLSDNDIHHFLQKQGIHIARRTVAKYRQQLNIPPAQERRRN